MVEDTVGVGCHYSRWPNRRFASGDAERTLVRPTGHGSGSAASSVLGMRGVQDGFAFGRSPGLNASGGSHGL
jgi:hypothetical protein